MNNNKLEYILSGTSYLRCQSEKSYEQFGDIFDDAFKKVKDNINHDFGLLYNGFTEKNFGPILSRFKNLDSIHADSGGLQMVTLNMQITEELKSQVYENQSKWSDIAMSFDEIPVKVAKNNINKNDVSDRWFDVTELEYRAKQTGINLRNQIETFVNNKSKAKPLFIIQGNDYDTFMKWAEYALSEVPLELRDYIGGVATAGAALGQGMLEDIERAFYFKQIPLDAKHQHILGVGSLKRLLPAMVFCQSGYYKDLHISYDSTTHSSGGDLGSYFMNGRLKSFGREFNPYIDISGIKGPHPMDTYTPMYEDIIEVFDELPQYLNLEEFHTALNVSATTYTKELGLDHSNHIRAKTYLILKSVINFCRHVEILQNSRSEILKVAKKSKMSGIISTLYDIHTAQDFKHWFNEVGRYVKTNRVANKEPVKNESILRKFA